MASVYLAESSCVAPHAQSLSGHWVESLPLLPFDEHSDTALAERIQEAFHLPLPAPEDIVPAYPEDALGSIRKYWILTLFTNRSILAFPYERHIRIMEEGEIAEWEPANGKFAVERMDFESLAALLLHGPKQVVWTGARPMAHHPA